MNRFAKTFWSGLIASVFAAAVTCAPAIAQQQPRTNIVVIWGDDIGLSNVSAYSRGLMGYQTPNIDRSNTEAPR
jgi:arylsulfatase